MRLLLLCGIGGRGGWLGGALREGAAGSDNRGVDVLADHIETLRVHFRLRRSGTPEDVIEIVAVV